ncbi:MAG: CUB domain-containing protein, partial [Bacteroidia bacterium]
MSRITLPILLSLGWAQVVLLDGTSNAGSFESGNVCNTGTFTADGWTIVNGNQPNRWAIHTGAGAQHGSRAIYISTYNYPPIPGCTYIMTQNPQTVNLQAAGCCGGANFYDSGGPNGNYSNNENRTITFVAPPGQRVYVVFLSFNTEANFDFLRAYDGPNTGSPLIGTYSGTTLPPTINSTGNSLTFNFTSDGSVVGSGWSAMVFCGPPPPGCLAVPPHEYNIAASSVVHFYRDVTLPAGHSQMTISAYVKVQGEGTTTKYDYLDIRVTPTNVTPVAGTEVTSGNLVGRYNLISSNWTQITGLFCGTPGQTYRVIFSWHNDPSLGTQPPAAVDQIHITASPASGTSVVCDAPVLKDFPVVTSGNTAGAPPVVASPSCVTGGGCGIVARWYQFIPSAPNMTIHVMPGTLTDPAVAVFSAPSCEGPFTQLAFACNDNWTACDGSSRAARLELTGLVVGEIYYVAVFAGAGGGSGDYTLGIW